MLKQLHLPRQCGLSDAQPIRSSADRAAFRHTDEGFELFDIHCAMPSKNYIEAIIALLFFDLCQYLIFLKRMRGFSRS